MEEEKWKKTPPAAIKTIKILKDAAVSFLFILKNRKD